MPGEDFVSVRSDFAISFTDVMRRIFVVLLAADSLLPPGWPSIVMLSPIPAGPPAGAAANSLGDYPFDLPGDGTEDVSVRASRVTNRSTYPVPSTQLSLPFATQ